MFSWLWVREFSLSAGSELLSWSPWAMFPPSISKHSISSLPGDPPTWLTGVSVFACCVRGCANTWVIAQARLSPSAQRTSPAFSRLRPFFLPLVSRAELLSQIRSLSALIYLVHNLPRHLLFFLFRLISAFFLYLVLCKFSSLLKFIFQI